MTNKDIKLVITFEEDMRPTVNMTITFDDSEDMGTYLTMMKDTWEKAVQDNITAKEILDKMKRMFKECEKGSLIKLNFR